MNELADMICYLLNAERCTIERGNEHIGDRNTVRVFYKDGRYGGFSMPPKQWSLFTSESRYLIAQLASFHGYTMMGPSGNDAVDEATVGGMEGILTVRFNKWQETANGCPVPAA